MPMDDIFLSAAEGSESAVKGLYASALMSCYEAVSATVEDQTQCVQIVQEVFASAFLEAKDYDDFFLLLNKRALSACRLYANKNVEIALIEPTQSIFFDVAGADIPQELKTFDTTLAKVIEKKNAQKKSAKKPFKKAKKETGNELETFSELIKKREFSGFDSYEPPKEEEEQKPKSLVEKMKGEEPLVTDEQRVFENKELEKNKKTALIAFVFAAVILVGAIVTYVITGQITTRRLKAEYSVQAKTVTEPTVDKTYSDEDAEEAFADYIEQVLLVKYGQAQTSRIVAYSENGNVGTDHLCGLIGTEIYDINADEQKELIVYTSDVNYEANHYCNYRFLMFIYQFRQRKVEPLLEDYVLMEYRTYNQGGDYTIGDFQMFLQNVEHEGKRYIYAEAASEDLRINSFHYFDNGSMFEGERFVYFSPQKGDFIYLRRYVDGTHIPLYLCVNNYYEPSAEDIPQPMKREMDQHRLKIGSKNVQCTNEQEVVAIYNEAFERIGFQIDTWNMRLYDDENTDGYICSLVSKNEQGDMLSRQCVVQITDYLSQSETQE